MDTEPKLHPGERYSYLQLPFRDPLDSKWKDRWRCLNSPKQWDGDLTLKEISELPDVDLKPSGLKNRIVSGRSGIRGPVEKRKRQRDAWAERDLWTKFLLLPAPKNAPKPTFSVDYQQR